MKTVSAKHKNIKKEWHLFDAKGRILGRLATQIATLLMGKNKVYYSQHLDCGDWVVVTNAEKIKVSGKKEKQKLYRHHTGFPGGFREYTFTQLMDKDPRKVIYLAVKGMLPKNRLRDERLKRLRVFTGGKHPYEEKFEKKERN